MIAPAIIFYLVVLRKQPLWAFRTRFIWVELFLVFEERRSVNPV